MPRMPMTLFAGRGGVCAARARQRRTRAARFLEFALHLDDLAAGIRAGTMTGYGNAESQEERARLLREDAATELRGLPA